MQSLDELRSFLTSVLVVALSEDVGYVDGIAVPAETCLQSANNCIKGVPVEDFDHKSISELEDCNSEDVLLCWQKWSDDLYFTANASALESQNGNIVNAFYNPSAAKKIKNLIQDLPLWTGVMRPYFKTGTEVSTSSSVESLFAEYKTRLFKGSIPMRVNKFVAYHLDYLDGRLRLDYAANYAFSSQKYKVCPKTETDIQDSEQYSEFSKNSHVHSTPISDFDNPDFANNSNINSNKTDNSYNIETCSKDSFSSASNDTLNDPLNCQENWMGLANKNMQRFRITKKNHTWINVPNGKASTQQMRFSYP